MDFKMYFKWLVPAYALLCLLAVVAWGCLQGLPDDTIGTDESGGIGSEAVVTFATGGSSVATRTPFADQTPVKIFIYQHPGGASLQGTPYKTVEGVTDGQAGNLSIVRLTGGDVTDGDKLIVSSGRTYDFILVVNGVPGAKLESIGFPASGVISGFPQGMDILAGRQTQEVAYGAKEMTITFKAYGADTEGNLPHLGSAVKIEGRATQALINKLGGSVNLAVAGVDFKQCMPKNASLPFTQIGQDNALFIQGAGYNTTYTAGVLTNPVAVTSPGQTVTSADGYILPYPLLTAGQNYNVLNMDFRLQANGGEALLQAPGIQVPEFKPGYRYKFIMELDYIAPAVGTDEGIINLYVAIQPWAALSWQSGMGESEDTDNIILVSLGSWSSVAWNSAMGAADTTDKVITSVAGWETATWSSQMGDW